MRQNLTTSIKDFDKEQSYKARWEQVQSLASTVPFGKDGYTNICQPYKQRMWLEREPNFSVGDLVLVVEEVFPDIEGFVRRVTVRTANGTISEMYARYVCWKKTCWDNSWLDNLTQNGQR